MISFQEDQAMRNIKNARITISLIAICVAVYLVSFLLYGLTMSAVEGLEFGGFNPIYVIHYNQYYRLITACFIHFGIIHLAFNMYSLYIFGSFMEWILKTGRYFALSVAGLLCSTVIPLVLYLLFGMGANTVLGGISGLIFAYLGAFTYLSYRYPHVFKQMFRQLVPILLLNLFISISVPSISLVGHLGGYLGGMVIMAAIEYVKPLRNQQS